jgi:uncharacterized membrane protein
MINSIFDWWNSIPSNDKLYWGVAIISSALFLIQLVTTLIGIDTELEADIDDIDTGFSLFSLRSILGFAVFFGWGGVAAIANGVAAPKVVMIAFLAGFLAMVGIAYAFAQVLKLQDSGTVDVMKSLGERAEVYIPIPAAGTGLGKIQLSLEGKIMEFDAKTDNSELISTGEQVEVLEIQKGNLMIVKPILI